MTVTYGGNFKWDPQQNKWVPGGSPTLPTANPNTYGYGRRTCPTCVGTGINPVLKTHVCPKCNGERTIVGGTCAPIYPYYWQQWPWYSNTTGAGYTVTYSTTTK